MMASGPDDKKNDEICPKCGYAMTAQTITDLPGAKIRRQKKEAPLEVPRKSDEICPKCGYAMTAQTITDLPRSKIRRKKKEVTLDVPKKDRGEVCVNCRTSIPGNLNICPKCGLNPSVQTMTDLPPWKE
jgi:RNA polymerase subunit RPABC4/transcription elongation factor Spt4